MAQLVEVPEIYRFLVWSQHRKRWEEWSGTFTTEQEAQRWYRLHGTTHEANGRKLGLFHKLQIKNPVTTQLFPDWMQH